MSQTPEPLILASQSTTRRAMLTAAGLDFDAVSPAIDEELVRESLRAAGADAAELAETLAEMKAQRISNKYPGALVIGCDQTLDCNGVMFDKPVDPDHARAHLQALSGKTHLLYAAICISLNGSRIWHHNAVAKLTMRSLSPEFLDWYCASEGEALLHSVGCYRLEGLGAQLFNKVDGDHFTILGLPLLPLLDFLRLRGTIRG